MDNVAKINTATFIVSSYTTTTATKTTTRSVSSYLSVKDKTTPTDVTVSPVNSTPFELNALTMLMNVEAVPVMSPSLDSILRILFIATFDSSDNFCCDQFNNARAALICDPVINSMFMCKINPIEFAKHLKMCIIHILMCVLIVSLKLSLEQNIYKLKINNHLTTVYSEARS